MLALKELKDQWVLKETKVQQAMLALKELMVP
jgi:hypothetical protein